MKRIFLAFLVSGLLWSGGVQAQSTDGGFPWSITEQTNGIRENIPVTILATPDYAAAAEEDKISSHGAYRYGLEVDANVNMQNSGKFIYLDNGKIIWTAKVKVDGAIATAFVFDKFYLPKGVNLFIKNENGKQIVGAFNEKYNPDDGIYSTTLIQGTTAVIELNIESGVNISDIQLNINQVIAAYRGGMAEGIAFDYRDGNDILLNTANRPLDASDPCNVNAICYPEGTTYEKLRRTAAHIRMGGYVCSGNLINNVKQDCKPLFLTASHCESTSSMSNSTFGSWMFYFNYEYPSCSVNNTPISAISTQYITGAKFLSRSPYDSSTSSMIGDFLLLELKDNANKLGNNFNAYLAGWDRTAFAPQSKHIGFHHPVGDPKKLTVFAKIVGTGSFNGGMNGSHWQLSQLEKGGIQGGSSGSGIFTMSTGRLIGDLSGGPNMPSPCDINGVQNYSVYSKLNLNWEYNNGGDGTSATRLKDWLDPNNTDTKFMNTVKMGGNGAACGSDPFVSVTNVKNDLSQSVNVYPNPSNGIVMVQLNLANAKDIQINVYNLLGEEVDVYSVTNAVSGNVKVDLSRFPAGVYLLKINADGESTSKKVVLNK